VIGALSQKIKVFRERHATALMAIFFLAGFLLDVFTLARIDQTWQLLQHAGYLGVLGWLVSYELKLELTGSEPPGWVRRLWAFREDAIHFILGSLLSAFSLFYFKERLGHRLFGLHGVHVWAVGSE
jgi:hypothetical protein